MTDNLDRVFVEVAYEEGTADSDQLVQNLEILLKDFGHKVAISKDRPPRIFNDQELEDRFLNLWQTAEHFKDAFTKRFNVEIEIDPRLLYISVISAFDDIERYKAYHLEKPYKDRSDAVKRSAYLTKWLSKLAPFQTRYDLDKVSEDKEIDTKLVDAKPALANILFSIMVSMTHISIECQKRTYLTTETEFQLSYDLLYRRVNEDALLSTYQKVMDMARGGNIIRQA